MLCIKENIKTEIVIKNSKFICYLYRIDNLEDINNYLKQIKGKEKNATHYCYAYILDNNKRFTDDGEPGGTAGMPMLNILESNNLNHILAVVVRYFGGIKLGANGLVHAYQDSVKESLDLAEICTLTKGREYEIIFDYNNIKQIEYLLKDSLITDKLFLDNVKFIFQSKNEEIINKLSNYIISYKYVKEILISE